MYQNLNLSGQYYSPNRFVLSEGKELNFCSTTFLDFHPSQEIINEIDSRIVPIINSLKRFLKPCKEISLHDIQANIIKALDLCFNFKEIKGINNQFFIVICDRVNNSRENIENGNINISIYFAKE